MRKFLSNAISGVTIGRKNWRLKNSNQKNRKMSLHDVLWDRAVLSSADFVEQFVSSTLIFRNEVQIWNYAINKVKENNFEGTCLEFGVAGGKSINYLSEHLSNFQFFGFDSFVGLREDWIGHHRSKGAYSRNGSLPKVNNNVCIIEGWFQDTLMPFIESHDLNQVKLIHIDSDTYEAAKIVLDSMGPHFEKGTLVLFDEFIGYPNWQNGEYKALAECEYKHGVKYRFLAFASHQALIEIV